MFDFYSGKDYITRRKLFKLLKYIKNKGLKVKITDDHDCSFEGCRWCKSYTGVITDFSVTSYEDAQIKLLIQLDKEKAEIWLSNEYFIYKFDIHSKMEYTYNNGDGTYSNFIIEVLEDN